ncbi:hypothetical protein IT407_03465 [Candidatus Uhrbacteria bacterium]|nr:hypothetical protein [Candidatus Uhrbacteria bacterium]
MKRFTCEQARDYLDSAKAELDLFKQRVEQFRQTGDIDVQGLCEIRKEFLQEAVDELMEGMRICKLERAKEILGEEYVLGLPPLKNQFVPFSESQLKIFHEENETDARRKTVLVEFESFTDEAIEEINKMLNPKTELPPLKSGWRLMQTDVLPQSAGSAGDGLELYTHQIEIMRRYEKEKKLTEFSIRHASPHEVLFLQYAKKDNEGRQPILNQRGYNLLTDIQGDDGGVVVMRVADSAAQSDLVLDYIPRHSRFSRIGCLAVIEPDAEAKPPKRMIDVAGI